MYILKTDVWRETEALKRYQMIGPLLDDSLDDAKRRALRKVIAEQNDISQRSLYRYESAYRLCGFAGLKPMERRQPRSKKLPENFEELVREAIQLKREVPKRSVRQIIFILENEGRVAPGKLKRSTLERYLYNAGFSVKQMRMYNDARESSSKRFCKPHRMMLIELDLKYGPYLPIGKDGASKRTYLSSAIDNHSRYVIHSQFYDNQEASVVEDTFHRVILKAGKFDAAYIDNGKQYTAKQINMSLAKLGMRVIRAKAMNPQSKGEIEKFHQIVDQFIREAKIHKIKTLEDLNHHWRNYLEEYYHKSPHEGIKEYYKSLKVEVPSEGITPLQEWNRDSRALKFLDVSVVAEAFRHRETRRVNKGACISFEGRQYETKQELIGCVVEITYDPDDTEKITVSYPGIDPFIAEPLKIGEFCDKKSTLPLSMQPKEAESSRFLDVLEKKSEEALQHRADAISFNKYRKDGSEHV